ncbi:MAG: hypothetical protein WAL47_20295, partial [Pyrinomonadaceae bacterium]
SRARCSQYHQVVAGGPIEWHSSLAERHIFTLVTLFMISKHLAQELSATPSGHRLPPGGTDFTGPAT